MAEPGFTIEIDDSRLKAVLKKLDKGVRNLKPVMDEVGGLLVTSIKRNFEEGGRYSQAGDWRGGSKKWQPLSVATLFSGKKNRLLTKTGRFSKKGIDRLKNREILIKESTLFDSINWQADSDSVEVGSNEVYAAIHQFGGKAGRGRKVTIPARPYLVVQQEDLDETVDILEDYLLGKI